MEKNEIITKTRIVQDLNRMGITEGAILAVHSSLKSIGQVEGGPGTVVEALMQAVGNTGTLLMPVFSGTGKDIIDLRIDPSTVGAVTEAFRQFPGVIRSHNPTHSVAVAGKHAEELADCHLNTSQLGADSPFHRLAEMGGIILHLGTDFSSCSLVHVAEAIARVPYLSLPWPGQEMPIKYITPQGEEKVFDSDELPGDGSGFRIVQWELDRRGLLNHGKIGESASFSVKGNDILEAALELLERDPAALLCRNKQCPVCAKSYKMVGDYLDMLKNTSS
ncbi:MAG: AAC(3) family N-acetyltransferase [bacterium]